MSNYIMNIFLKACKPTTEDPNAVNSAGSGVEGGAGGVDSAGTSLTPELRRRLHHQLVSHNHRENGPHHFPMGGVSGGVGGGGGGGGGGGTTKTVYTEHGATTYYIREDLVWDGTEIRKRNTIVNVSRRLMAPEIDAVEEGGVKMW